MKSKLTRWLLTLIIACSPWFTTRTPAHAVPITQTDTSATNTFLILFPELKSMAAPAWLKEGTRVTYTSASATIGGDTGGSSNGYIQYDVVAADKKNVVTNQSSFLDVNGNGVLSAIPPVPAVELSGTGIFWINPAVLVDAEQVASDNLSVSRMTDQDTAGNRYEVVRFQYEEERSSFASAIDVETGLLIFYTQTIVNLDGTRSEAQLRLSGVRQLKLPWKGKTPPSWIKKGLTLNYVGSQTTTMEGTPSLQLPYTYSATLRQVNKRFTLLTTSTTYNNQPLGSIAAITGVAQLTGLWLPKEALKSKGRAGRIDRDPITGVEVSWQRDSNRNIVVSEVGPSWQSTFTYDGSSGALIVIQISQLVGFANQLIELTLQE